MGPGPAAPMQTPRTMHTSLAMVHSPEQPFEELYSPEEGLAHGTLFKELYKPFTPDDCGEVLR